MSDEQGFYSDICKENANLKQRLDECEKALEGRFGVSDEAIKWACEEYVATENELPDCFDVEDYQLHKAVASLVASNSRMESTLTHYESALKEAKCSLDACHAHTVHGEVMTRDECHLCKTLATINKVLETT